jgi:hypothetical protein
VALYGLGKSRNTEVDAIRFSEAVMTTDVTTGITIQKAVTTIFTAVRISNLT